MKYDARACHFNMDTGCVELLLRDGRKIFIDCTGVEDALDVTMAQRAELDYQMCIRDRGGGHNGGPLDLPEALEIRCAVHLSGFHDGLIHIAQRRNIQHDGLADGGGEQDEDDAAQCILFIAQPVDVLVDEAHSLAQIVEDAVVVVVHLSLIHI